MTWEMRSLHAHSLSNVSWICNTSNLRILTSHRAVQCPYLWDPMCTFIESLQEKKNDKLLNRRSVLDCPPYMFIQVNQWHGL